MFWIRLVCAALGTALSVLYLLMLARGRKYQDITANLESFENRDLCNAGFAMQEIPALALRGKLGKQLRVQADLLYGSTYQEYYARLYYARALSVTVLLAAVLLLASSLLNGSTLVLLLLAAAIAVAGIWISQISEMKKTVDRRREACLNEFPNVISKLALLVSSGMILFQAWSAVAESREGEIYDLMRRACQDVGNGMSESDAYYRFGVLSDCQDIRKFSSMLVQSLEKGGSELTMFLMQQSKELWSQKRQRALQEGDAAAAKLLVPTVLMLAGIMLIILSAVFMSMTLAF
ncbi:type II secretion system F family protein [uncultured Oscillibacter sp.]|uniref:type II secretion system F family protein n=1 Tax=uncultured Oscillibacter sp. TaxID=876091 RepID=UPI0025DB2EEC|nr:type II secretion system F family protein [uncultured Oscillibacter sp.]